MSKHYLEFEREVGEIEKRIAELKSLEGVDVAELPIKDLDEEIDRLEIKQLKILRRIYRKLTPWQKVQVSRHQDRPHASDYVNTIIDNFVPIAGDKRFKEDPCMISGIGKFRGRSVVVLGTEKGRNTRERVKYSFGMPKPEGYRKARRLMQMANKFNMPIITFVDTPGAFPGVEAEARGQSEAIASCIETLLEVDVPVVSVITGEGGSGGALAIATANKVLMLEHSIYSVISPEGCASILWRDAKSAEQASEALKLTSETLEELNIVDDVIKEPVGGAQRDPHMVIKRTSRAIEKSLRELEASNLNLKQARTERFLALSR